MMLVSGGFVLLFLGARDFLESRLGQAEAGQQFEALVPDAAPASVPVASPPAVPTRVAPPKVGSTVAKLIIPRLAAELYVLEGDGARELRRGPGHLTGTALPGEKGNCVIAAHRDTHFRILKDIRRGDKIVLQTARGRFLYRVRSTRVVSPRNTEALQPTSAAELNLITCYPFYYVGPAPRRFVVEARLAASRTETASQNDPPRRLAGGAGRPTS